MARWDALSVCLSTSISLCQACIPFAEARGELSPEVGRCLGRMTGREMGCASGVLRLACPGEY